MSPTFLGKSNFPTNFFDALHRHDVDAAMSHFKAEAFDANQAPSPRAKELIDKGEWDVASKLSLIYIDATSCKGRVGNEGSRFCGRKSEVCSVSTHKTNVLPNIATGWYIANGGRGGGVFSDHYLPPADQEGPITSNIAAQLMDPESDLKMTKGQWVFVIEAWHTTRLQSWDDGGDEDSIGSGKDKIEATDNSNEKNTTYRRVKDIEMYVALDSDISNVISTPSLITSSTAVLLKYHCPTKTRNDEIIVISNGTIIYRNHRDNLSLLGRYNSYEIIKKDVLQPLSQIIPQAKYYIPDDSHGGAHGSQWCREISGFQLCSIIRHDVQGARKRKHSEKLHRWRTPKKVELDENKKRRPNVPNSS